jgi:N-methylhydantoinase A
MAWVIGVDVGGTFTDFSAFEEATGKSFVYKVSSTPEQPGRAIVAGFKSMCDELGLDKARASRLAHGTTVATNALIQRRGGRIAFVTTKGFRDLLEIGRQARPHMFDLQRDIPPPLVPRELRFEIAERILADGSVHRDLRDEDIDTMVKLVAESGVDACAVCFLFAFVNADHERRVGERLRAALPGVNVSLSSEVQPEFREYERFSTTVLNAYLQPVVGRYLDDFEKRMVAEAPHVAISICQSAGGLMSLARARDLPVRTALSGPAAGVMGALDVARRAKRPNFLTFDMGGTSTDVSMVREFSVDTAPQRTVAEFPIRLPMVDIETIGAGGGSIAWFERDGLLKVGPTSAGALPGPACYGKGGTALTVTDANLILGRLSPGGFIGGRMRLDPDAARRACEPIAERLGITPERAAHGVISIVVSNMVRALRTVSIERGRDPRGATLLAFGGAGPLHAADVARNIGITEVLVPRSPGILCAQGLVISDLVEEFVMTAVTPLDESHMPAMIERLSALMGQAKHWFNREDVAEDRRRVEVRLDMRYSGQNFELSVALDGVCRGDRVAFPNCETIVSLFHKQHEQVYGFFNRTDTIEVVNYRLSARAHFQSGDPNRAVPMSRAAAQPRATLPVYFDSEAPHPTPIYHRDDLVPGHKIVGPAVVEQFDATTLIFPSDRMRVDDALNMLIEVHP